MSGTWQVQEAKARFSEFLESSLAEGPQVVTRRGIPAAVLVPIDQWERVRDAAHPNLRDWLLDPRARTEALTPDRREVALRPPPEFG